MQGANGSVQGLEKKSPDTADESSDEQGQYREGNRRKNHMKDLKKMLEETNGLYSKIDRILKSSTYDDYDDLSGLDIDYRDGEQLFFLEELQSIMRNLDEVRDRLVYLALPVRKVSRLHRNESERYETDGGHYYTCGSLIEALVEDGYRDVPYWVRTTLEHNGKDYFLVGYGSVEMEGLTVRVRGEV